MGDMLRVETVPAGVADAIGVITFIAPFAPCHGARELVTIDRPLYRGSSA